jgi:hypothetical protein
VYIRTFPNQKGDVYMDKGETLYSTSYLDNRGLDKLEMKPQQEIMQFFRFHHGYERRTDNINCKGGNLHG